MRRLLPLLPLLLALSACGDPLVGEAFVGTPQLSLGGVVLQSNPRIPSSHGRLQLSLFWVGAAAGTGGRVEQGARLDAGLAEFSMTLFDAPPPAAAGFSTLLDGEALAVGVIVLYADVDESGDLDLERDLLLGAGAEHLVVFAGATVRAGSAVESSLGAIGPGYHLYAVDRPGSCRFVGASDCPASGALTRLEETDRVPLTLWPEPSEVLVPAPSLGPGGESIWAAE